MRERAATGGDKSLRGSNALRCEERIGFGAGAATFGVRTARAPRVRMPARRVNLIECARCRRRWRCDVLYSENLREGRGGFA